MPSQFLKDRYRKSLHESSGTNTVEYVAFSNTTVNSLTGDVNESQAYPEQPVSLPARIEFSPSRATRNRIGRDIDFDAIVRLAKADLDDKEITLKIGDQLILTDMTNPRYIIKILPSKQVVEEHIEYLVLVSRKQGNRG